MCSAAGWKPDVRVGSAQLPGGLSRVSFPTLESADGEGGQHWAINECAKPEDHILCPSVPYSVHILAGNFDCLQFQ